MYVVIEAVAMASKRAREDVYKAVEKLVTILDENDLLVGVVR